MSGAQIANVVNEAALRAARSGSDLVKQEHFDEAIERVNSGIKKETGQNIDERKILATIEAGKCLSSWLLGTQDGVLKSSIVPRTHNKLGYTQFKQKERFLQSEEYLMDRIAVLQAGKISQKVIPPLLNLLSLFFSSYTAESTLKFKAMQTLIEPHN